MRRTGFALILALAMTLSAQAHFVYVVPQSAGNSVSVRVVFSDSLSPDENVPISKIQNTRLTLRDARGKESPLELKTEKTFLSADLPGTGSRTVYGTTRFGVLQKGGDKPFLLQYHPRAIVGGVVAETARVGEAVPVEIVPAMNEGKIRFQVLVGGKPAAKAEVSVTMPKGKEAEKVTTDGEGYTMAFDQAGTYALWARHSEAKAGEEDGKKYEEVRHYATLVVEFAGK